MNIQEFSEAMTDISDEYIEEAYNYQKASVFDFKKAFSAVATVAVLIAVALAVHFYTNEPVSTQPSDKAVETSDYTKDFSATNSYYDLAAPAVIPKSPKRLKSKVKKQIKSDYLSYSQSDTESKDFDIIYCGTYNGNIAFKVILKDGQNGGNTISESFADPNGKFSFLSLNYKENEPILLWSEKEGIKTLTQSYNSGTLNYEQVFSIWHWLCIETGELNA